jgi:hypothetical protein
MTLALQNLIVRSRRRIRAVFTDAVASGAFVTGFYSVTSLDGFGASPTINGVLVVPDSPQVVELSLAIDLADGAGYRLDVAAGVPALAGGTAGAGSYAFSAPTAAPAASPEILSDELLDAIYGNDIAFANDDFVETLEGDLATRGGIQNTTEALLDRALSDGLPWDDSYGAKPREFVDGSDSELSTLRSRTLGQFLQDDRVVSATAVSAFEQTGDATIDIAAVLVGQAVPVTIPVPSA